MKRAKHGRVLNKRENSPLNKLRKKDPNFKDRMEKFTQSQRTNGKICA